MDLLTLTFLHAWSNIITTFFSLVAFRKSLSNSIIQLTTASLSCFKYSHLSKNVPHSLYRALPTNLLLPFQTIPSPSLNSQCSSSPPSITTSSSASYTSHPCTYPYSHEPAAFASLLTLIILVHQLPTSTLPPSPHALSLNIIPISRAGRGLICMWM